MNRDQWINTYQTDKTKKQARIALNAFDKYLQAVMVEENKLFELIRHNDTEKYQTVQMIINFWKEKKISASSIKNYWNFIKNYWWHNDVKTFKEDMKAYVKFPKILKRMPEPLEKETIKLLVDNAEQPYKTHYLVLASSGMRIDESLNFSEANIELGNWDEQRPTRILLTPEITKGSVGREVFISQEASEMLEKNFDEYLKLKPSIAEAYFNKLRKQLGLTKKYSNDWNYHVQIHAFKSFFMTWAEFVHDHKYSNAVGGHRAYLPEYNRLPRITKEQMYLKLEPYVSVYEKSQIAKIN